MSKVAKKTETEKIAESKSSLPEVVFIRKLNKLDRFNNNLGKPRSFGQETYRPNSDPRDDTEIEFNGNSIPGAVRNLTPRRNSLSKQWAWEGTFQDLTRIANKLRLKDKDNKTVMPDEDSFRNIEDPFFNHRKLWYNQDLVIREGNVALRTINPLEEFYARSYMGDPRIQNSMKKQSTALVAGAELEVWSPKAETATKFEEIEKADKVAVLLHSMSLDKKRALAMVLRPTGFSPLEEDPKNLHIQLREAGLNTNTSSRFGGMKWQDWFIELAEKNDSELSTMATIIEGKIKGHINRKNGTYHLKGKSLYLADGVKVDSERDLIAYFTDPTNDNEYNTLDDLITNSK